MWTPAATWAWMPLMGPGGGLPAAHVKEDDGLLLGVGLVVGVARGDAQPVAGELGRPVTLLAGLPGRAEVVDGDRDGALVEVEGDRDELPGAGELRLHEPARPLADVAPRAGDARVRRALRRR